MGPVEFLILAFPGEELSPKVVRPLGEMRRKGGIRVIDTMVVTRRQDDSVEVSELAQQPHLQMCEVLGGGDEANLIGTEDALEAAQTLTPGSCALLLLVEHVWATEAANAFQSAGGRVVASLRVPPERIREAQRALLEAHR